MRIAICKFKRVHNARFGRAFIVKQLDLPGIGTVFPFAPEKHIKPDGDNGAFNGAIVVHCPTMRPYIQE